LRRGSIACRGYVFVLALVAALTVSLLHLADSPGQCGAERIVAETVERVQPGHYQPRKCSAWRFTEGSEQLLASLSAGLLAEAGQELLTANHVKLPVCLLAWRGNVLINPSLHSYSDPGRRGARLKRTQVPELCSAEAPELEMLFDREFELRWQTASRETQRLGVDGLDALRLQKALAIMNGTDVCGTGKRLE
jgi:hypothetical protein